MKAKFREVYFNSVFDGGSENSLRSLTHHTFAQLYIFLATAILIYSCMNKIALE